MRVCPKCGFVDPPEWRNSKFSPWIEVIHIEDFKRLHPNLKELLEKQSRFNDNNYEYYHAPKSSYVQRKWLEIAKHEKKFFSIYIERGHKKKLSPSQTKILEVDV